MATSDEVAKLASLARIEVPEGERETFAKEFDAILAYVGQLDGLTATDAVHALPVVRNVFREDKNPHESGMYTKKITEQFPKRDGDYLSVKPILP